jgi:hypothetical protein
LVGLDWGGGILRQGRSPLMDRLDKRWTDTKPRNKK